MKRKQKKKKLSFMNGNLLQIKIQKYYKTLIYIILCYLLKKNYFDFFFLHFE